MIDRSDYLILRLRKEKGVALTETEAGDLSQYEAEIERLAGLQGQLVVSNARNIEREYLLFVMKLLYQSLSGETIDPADIQALGGALQAVETSGLKDLILERER